MLRSLLVEAVDAILANRSRTILTLLGIVVGIASVITVIAAGDGGRTIVMQEFEGLSPTTLQIGPNWGLGGGDFSFRPETITDRDIRDLEQEVDIIESVTPMRQTTAVVRRGEEESRRTVTGTNSNYVDFVEFEIRSGRLLTPEEEANQSKSVIIGSLIADEFFPGEDPVGEYIRIFDTPFRVIGVLERKENEYSVSISNPDETFNNAVVVPVSVFRRFFGGEDGYWTVLAKAKSIELIEPAKESIIRVLTRNHGLWNESNDKFRVYGMKEQLDMIDTVLGTITTGVAVLAGISLLVAAIGIMNIMLVSVKERTREIGVRKAIGAKYRHIMMQFLMETLLLCGGGGVVGLGVAVAASHLIGHFAGWPAVVSSSTAAVAIGLSVITGLLSGFYPAARAAKLPPQEALRYE
ncbi:MAG: ABC transporter permease [Spirochaetota bacterium]